MPGAAPTLACLCNRPGEFSDHYRVYFEKAGFRLVHIPHDLGWQDISGNLASCDGLVLPGGGDFSVGSNAYDDAAEAEVAGLTGISQTREDRERDLLRWASDGRKPLFAICRGMQAMNVFLGGSLVPDLAARLGNAAVPAHRMTGAAVAGSGKSNEMHELIPETGEWYASLVDDRLFCNSHHHQALDRVADSLVVEGAAPDGVVEGVRHETLPWIGVQFHPESMSGSLAQLLLSRWKIRF